ncbi:MAG TPA: serine/threonine-protein kinase [Actinophytocola sp.]|uniref:serine/threonine-protein kinase n=1 Tax=Actinophytocola sp. TaxID=1872138 RepID=UPI002DBC8535|nr:serine/threonine-protein kinase [Actinophytocola sp.]HEU5475530.1 serine/threonine-protein kinase [Actinophytocola sp.]
MAEAGRTDLPEFGPYRILELLGQGGMGVVHKAYDTAHDRVIALKRLPASVSDHDFRARFQREARIVANLDHPNVIPVNAAGEIDGQLFLDMMLVDGTDLRRALGAGTIGQDQAITILTQVALALEAAHTSGLVHRDVKPSNILIDRDGHAYLADFGIARETSPEATELTRSGDLVGSWDYMAPERLSGGVVDGRADQYSLACVLFECLTGRLPHPGTDPAAKVAAHLLQPAPAPSVFVPTITAALDDVVRRGLAKDPARRFPTAAAMMTAAVAAAYTGLTVKSAAPTEQGPGRDRDQARLVRAILKSSAVRKPPQRRLDDRAPDCPYPGLRGFDKADADLFYGRDHVVTDLLVRLAEQLDGGEPVVLVGASGAGKSSVLRAGLLPALAAADGAEPAVWPQIVITPGPDPIATLAYSVANQIGAGPEELARTIRTAPTDFGARCAMAMGTSPVRPVIVVDQFEELFTHGTPYPDRIAFATALANAHPALVLVAVRADLMERCIELTPLLPALTAPVLLGPMDPTELRQAIVAPARDAGVEVEPGLPERLIADLGVRGEIGYDPGALPRLAHALRETWNHGDGRSLTLAAYRAAGGIDGAVARTAEEVYDRLDPSGRYALRAILLRLVTVLDDGGVARRRVDPHEFGTLRPILDRLIATRLVTVDDTGARLAHEALLTAWPRLRDWIDEDRAGLVQHRRLGDAVRTWTDSGRHDDDLYRGVRLSTLNTWLEGAWGRVQLQPAEQEFLARSNAAEHAGQLTARRRTRRLRMLVAGLSVLLVVASVAVFVATRSQREAVAERGRADEGARANLSRTLAAESALARGIDARRVALLALGAWRADETVEARSALLANQTDHYRGLMTGHTDNVTSVAVSGDGQVAATGSRDGSLRLWDVSQRRQIAVLDESEEGWYRVVSMSADGRLLAAADSIRHFVTLWSVPDRRKVFEVPGAALDTALSRDGKLLAANHGGVVKIWDTASQAELARFAGADNSLRMTLSPDGTMIAITSKEKVIVHRTSDGAVLATLTGHAEDITDLDFDATGGQLASSAFGGEVRVWDTRSWTQSQLWETVDLAVNAVAFTPQGALIAAGSAPTIYAWDPGTGRELLRLGTGATGKFDLAATADGHTLFSANADGSVTLWAFERVVLDVPGTAVIGVAAQPGGDLVATTSGDGAVILFDRTTGDRVRRLAGHTDAVPGVAFLPGGTELVTAGTDGALIVWDVATGAEKRRFTRPGATLGRVAVGPGGETIAVASSSPPDGDDDNVHEAVLLLEAADLSLIARRSTKVPGEGVDGSPAGLAFSPDGLLAVAVSDGKVVLMDLADPGAAFRVLPGHDGQAVNVAFSPDGALLATGGLDRKVRLWRVGDGQEIAEFSHDAVVRAVAFSPDGAMLATASQDQVLRLWDVPGKRPVARLDRHGDELNDVSFAGDDLVVTGSADGTARLWDLRPQTAVRTICGLLDQDRLAEEWRAIGPERGDPPRCPS